MIPCWPGCYSQAASFLKVDNVFRMCFSSIWKWYQQNHAKLNDWDSAWGVSKEMEVLFYALAHCALQLRDSLFCQKHTLQLLLYPIRGAWSFLRIHYNLHAWLLLCSAHNLCSFVIEHCCEVHLHECIGSQSKGSIMLPVHTASLTLCMKLWRP